MEPGASSRVRAREKRTAALPVGTLTFLFTDVEGSTRLWEHYPEGMRVALARHDALIEGHVDAHGGVLVRPRGEGDSRFAVFSRATDAVAAACAIQVSMVRERWPLPEPLHVRIALHTGETELRDGDYYGTEVNRCARLRAVAHGGQTLLSSITAELVHQHLPVAASLRSLGAVSLRDIEEPEAVFQLEHPAWETELPHPHTEGGIHWPWFRRGRRAAGLKWLGVLALLGLVGALTSLLMSRNLPSAQPAAETAAPTASPLAAASASPVLLAHLDGVVDPVIAEYVHRVVGAAEEQHFSLLVLSLDTPGGLDSSMRDIVRDLLNSPVPTVVYVGPSGARAASAGVFVAAAANLVAMAPGTTIGLGGPNPTGGSNAPLALTDKGTTDAAAYIASLAEQRGRSASGLQDAVRQKLSLTAQQALEQQVADVLAPDLQTLLQAIDGRSVTTVAGPVTLHTAGAQLTGMDLGLAELLAQKIFDPNVAYVLLTIGFFAILIELFHPGALLPGVTGAVCVILAFVAFSALPMNWAGVLLIVAAIGLFVIDVHVAVRGGATIAGLVCFVLGSLLLYSPIGPPSTSLPEVSVAWPVLILVAGLGAGLSLWIVSSALRMHTLAPISAIERLTGARGMTHTPLEPDGTVQVQGQIWSARLSSGRLDAGTPVRVLARKGLTLEVEADERVGPGAEALA
jgi:membrane-bound serine protease (ClpP class)